MEANIITPLAFVDFIHNHYNVKVRVLRMVRIPDFRNPEETVAIDLIVMDEQGTKRHARLARQWFPNFANIVQEGLNFYIIRPFISEDNHLLNFGHNSIQINFNDLTQIHFSPHFMGSIYGFSFNDFASIHNRIVPPNVYVDVIGQLIMVTPIHGNPRNKMSLQLENTEGMRLHVVLWDGYADQMHAFVTHHQGGRRVIIILQFAKITYWRGLAIVSTYHKYSKLFLNDDIVDIKDFYHRMELKDIGESFNEKLSLTGKSNKYGMTYNLPTGSEVAVLMKDE